MALVEPSIGANHAAATLRDWKSYQNIQPGWFYSALAYALLAAACLVASYIDSRTLLGISVWTKPFKFALSISVYFATLLWITRFLPTQFFATTKGKVIALSATLPALFEMSYILFQGSQGEASHFNFSSAFHITMYSLMGVGAGMMVLVLSVLAWFIARANALRSDPLAMAVVIGLVLTTFLGGGFGAYLSGNGGHWVNAANTDANGLAFFNWARDGGDLRVAHFFGMHAMQAIPIFALIAINYVKENMANAVVVAFACAYSAFATVTFLQAVSGQAFLA